MKLKDSFGTKNYGAKKPKQETILNHGKFTGNINKKLKTMQDRLRRLPLGLIPGRRN